MESPLLRSGLVLYTAHEVLSGTPEVSRQVQIRATSQEEAQAGCHPSERPPAVFKLNVSKALHLRLCLRVMNCLKKPGEKALFSSDPFSQNAEEPMEKLVCGNRARQALDVLVVSLTDLCGHDHDVIYKMLCVASPSHIGNGRLPQFPHGTQGHALRKRNLVQPISCRKDSDRIPRDKVGRIIVKDVGDLTL